MSEVVNRQITDEVLNQANFLLKEVKTRTVSATPLPEALRRVRKTLISYDAPWKERGRKGQVVQQQISKERNELIHKVDEQLDELQYMFIGSEIQALIAEKKIKLARLAEINDLIETKDTEINKVTSDIETIEQEPKALQKEIVNEENYKKEWEARINALKAQLKPLTHKKSSLNAEKKVIKSALYKFIQADKKVVMQSLHRDLIKAGKELPDECFSLENIKTDEDIQNEIYKNFIADKFRTDFELSFAGHCEAEKISDPAKVKQQFMGDKIDGKLAEIRSEIEKQSNAQLKLLIRDPNVFSEKLLKLTALLNNAKQTFTSGWNLSWLGRFYKEKKVPSKLVDPLIAVLSQEGLNPDANPRAFISLQVAVLNALKVKMLESNINLIEYVDSSNICKLDSKHPATITKYHEVRDLLAGLKTIHQSYNEQLSKITATKNNAYFRILFARINVLLGDASTVDTYEKAVENPAALIIPLERIVYQVEQLNKVIKKSWAQRLFGWILPERFFVSEELKLQRAYLKEFSGKLSSLKFDDSKGVASSKDILELQKALFEDRPASTVKKTSAASPVSPALPTPSPEIPGAGARPVSVDLRAAGEIGTPVENAHAPTESAATIAGELALVASASALSMISAVEAPGESVAAQQSDMPKLALTPRNNPNGATPVCLVPKFE